MPITDYNEYLTKLNQQIAADFQTSGTVARANRTFALWRFFVQFTAIPTTSTAQDKTSQFAISPLPNVSTGLLEILGGRFACTLHGAMGIILVDLLNISSGMSGIVTTAQTTNIPTAALTRYTNGEGVMAAIFIETAIGTTATTFTVSYTNQAGTAGRVSTATTIGATNFREQGALILIPLAAGDTGVRSVESVTLAATTGTAGNFGVCLFKPLAMMSVENSNGVGVLDNVSTGGVIGQFAQVNPNACLTTIVVQNAAQIVNGSILLNEV